MRHLRTPPQFEGFYGLYAITEQDRRDVQRHHLVLVVSGIAFSAGLLQWVATGWSARLAASGQ